MRIQSFKIIKNIFLGLAILSLIASVGYYFLIESNNPAATEDYYKSKLDQKISKEVSIAESDLNSVVKNYNSLNPKSFNQFYIKTVYPFYIFKNGKLSYWSDYRYVPEYDKIKQIKPIEVLNYNQKQFGIFLKKEFTFNNDSLVVISLVNLYQYYKNENDYLQSEFNDKIFQPAPQQISLNNSEGLSQFFSKKTGINFYYKLPGNEKILSSSIPKTTLWILSFSIIMLCFYFYFLIKSYIKVHSFVKAFISLFVFLVSLRLLTIKTGIPFVLTKKDFFNPSFYSGNILSPTFGDTILNSLFLLIFLAVLALYYYRSGFFLSIIKSTGFVKSIISVLLVVAVMLISYYCNLKIQNIYDFSLYKLGFSLSLNFTTFKIITLIYYLLLLGIFFLGTHLAINIFLRLQKHQKAGFFHWLYGFIAGSLILFLIIGLKMTYVYAGIYFWVVYYFKLSKFFYTIRFQTLFYLILGGFCFALIAIETIENQENKKNILDKKNFGYRYLAENDLLGEGLIDKYTQTIQEDSKIKEAFAREILPLEVIKQIIKNEHLDLYFDKYDIEIKAFDNQGYSIDGGLEKLEAIEQRIVQKKYKTGLKNLYFINDTGNTFIKEYVAFTDIKDSDKIIGTIVLDLKLKDENSESVYPELLMDKKFVQNPESKNFSYAILSENKKILISSGAFNYMMNFPVEFLNNPELFNKGLSFEGFNHLAIKGRNSRIIVVSQPELFWKTILSNFSFLFLLSILGISIVVLLFSVAYGIRKFSMNFSTKIQFYLNAAFLLPLIIIIILTLSVVRNTLVVIQEKSFVDNTKNIASTLQVHLENYLQGKSSRAFFEMEINNLARNTKLDINYFDTLGKLNFSTRPLVYQYKLLSEQINPLAYNKIIEEKENEVLANESLGTLNYKTVYISLKGNGNKNYGVIAIPFFDAKTLLDKQVKEVVATVLIIFLSMFLLLLVLSYFASNQLTSPLKHIAQRLKRTNLDKLDQALEWKSNDEIGLLTKSYNNMLKKLDESKIALSQSEKQTAWREMAKQVAHEIKNPLTPMKLSIQQLQRTLPMDDPKSRDRIQRALNSLTEQIDNISEIANSFSEFAKMPVPRNERFDLVSVSQKTTDLYSQNNNIKIDFESTNPEMMVLGDRLLVSRVITNLILNGIQSVPPIRQPEIKVRIYKNPEENAGIIEVNDNGAGIPEEVRKKVFIPNFSTKVGGSGLGLAMAKRGIEHAGGNIWFESEEGVGTTFFVDLPISFQ